MLSEQFLNLSCVLSICEDAKLSPDVYRDMKAILAFYNKQDDDIPLNVKLKFDLALSLCKLKLQGMGRDTILDSVKSSKKYIELSRFLSTIEDRKLTDHQIDEYTKQVKAHKKVISSLANFEQIRQFINNFEQNNFDSIHDAISSFESMVEGVYSSYSSEKRTEGIASITHLDLYDDNYKDAIDQIQTDYSGENALPSGIRVLDRNINKGFAPSRLYIFGGASGDGKSTLLLNILKNILRTKCSEDKDSYDIHIYVTLENLIHESLLRLYCCYTGQTTDEVIMNYAVEKKKIGPVLRQAQEDSKSIIVMVYYPATSVSSIDLMALAEQVKLKYAGVGKLKSFTIDYLDLVKAGREFDLHRLELGQVTVDFKVMSVMLHVPVLTVTQLNRGSYGKGKEDLSLALVGESIKKVEHADFFGLLRTNQDEKEDDEDTDVGTMTMVIGKNRSGPKDKRLVLKTDFSRYSITDNSPAVNMVSFEDVKEIMPKGIL